VDEAARVDNDLYFAVKPMFDVFQGQTAGLIHPLHKRLVTSGMDRGAGLAEAYRHSSAMSSHIRGIPGRGAAFHA